MAEPDQNLVLAVSKGILNDKQALKQLHDRRANFLARPDLLPSIKEQAMAIFATAIEVDVPRASSVRGKRLVQILQDVLVKIGGLLCAEQERLVNTAAATGQKRKQPTDDFPMEAHKFARHENTEQVPSYSRIEATDTGLDNNPYPSPESDQSNTRRSRIVVLSIAPRSTMELTFPPLPPVNTRDPANFHKGALIAVDNIKEAHVKDKSIPLLDIIQDLEDNKPTVPPKSVCMTILSGADWVYGSLRSVWAEWESRHQRDRNGNDASEGAEEFIGRALEEFAIHMETQYEKKQEA